MADSIVAVQSGPFTPLSARIERFRDASAARLPHPQSLRTVEHFEHAFFDLHARAPFWERYARSVGYAFEQQPVLLFDDERIVGLTYQGGVPHFLHGAERGRRAPFCAWTHSGQRVEREIADPYLRVWGAPGHVGWRWDRILADGVEGLMADLRRRLRSAPDARAKRLYRGALILWRSVLRWNDRHVAAMRERLPGAAGEERARLETLIALCSRVPRKPARSFREAVQSFHVQYLAVMFENPFGGNGPGRLDYFLWPFLKRDLERGAITMEEAKELVDELLIRFGERLQGRDGWVEAAVPGGVHPDGSDAVNPLSYMLIHSFGMLNQTHPIIYPRVSSKSPDDFVDLCAAYLLHGQNRAQIYNDDVCIPALMKTGKPLADAAMYMAGGCMEISVQGMNSDLNWAFMHNVAKTFELVLNGGVDLLDGARHIPPSRDLGQFDDFEGLYAALEAELLREYATFCRCLDIASECYARWRPCYLLSSLMGDCLERGREQQDGGARHNDWGFAVLGITTVADSLTAIKTAVFDERRVSAAELLAALRANFEGHEALRARLRNLPKYGQEDAEADAMCDRVLHSVCEMAMRPKNRFGGTLKPMAFNFVWTPGESRRLGARADGSRAGDALGHGMTPQGFAVEKGITAAINSATSIDYECIAGGATTMWDMDHEWIDFERMRAIFRAFLARGGMIFQGNTTSVKELEDAYDHPEKYPHLIVRVGGFSARFVTLDRALQQDIIARRRHRG